MQYVTIASTGNTADFGDLNNAYGYGGGAAADPTRGLFAGGVNDSGKLNVIDFITIASTGNATDFGNLSSARQQLFSGMIGSAHGGL